MTEGLRERKKQQTREAIHAAAVRLFAEQGYGQTTVAQIAEAAEVSPRTFFTYFASKEDVVFADFEPAIESFEAALDVRPPDQSALEAMRHWMRDVVPTFKRAPEHEMALARIIVAEPVLAAKDRECLDRFGRVLTEQVARDLGEPPDALTPRLVAAAVVAALDAANAAARAEAGEDVERLADLQADPTAYLDDALVFLEGGLAALQAHRTA